MLRHGAAMIDPPPPPERNDGLSRRAVRGRVAECEHVRFVNEEPHCHRQSHGRNGRMGHDLVH